MGKKAQKIVDEHLDDVGSASSSSEAEEASEQSGDDQGCARGSDGRAAAAPARQLVEATPSRSRKRGREEDEEDAGGDDGDEKPEPQPSSSKCFLCSFGPPAQDYMYSLWRRAFTIQGCQERQALFLQASQLSKGCCDGRV